tara:strand:+ start:746 stop:919 length:174 start_codon:yes stop_codon:yes gene_type:complete
MKNKETSNKLNLSKETVSVLGSDSLKNIKGGAVRDKLSVDWDIDNIEIGEAAPKGLY